MLEGRCSTREQAAAILRPMGRTRWCTFVRPRRPARRQRPVLPTLASAAIAHQYPWRATPGGFRTSLPARQPGLFRTALHGSDN
jgi:hypothetical protein